METKTRTFVKTLSWRFFATIITASLGFLFTGSWEFAAKIGLADTTIKLLAYYFHERAWVKFGKGYIQSQYAEGSGV